MSHVFYRNSRTAPPLAAHGDGVYLVDSAGRRYLDGSGGAAVSCLGHSDRSVIRAVQDQIADMAFAHSGFFTSAPAEALADKLVSHAPPGIDRVYFTAGGSEAVETALKMARQYFVETGAPARTRFISRRQSYHGNTLGALAAGGNLWRQKPFAPLLADISHIAPCYSYRDRTACETQEDYGLRVANELEAELLRVGPETVIGFIAEPVVGATLGAVPPVAGYFRRIREICDQYGILLILDEVMCGMGRTGTLFACEQDDVIPDIITIAKGLGAGYQPIGATLCQARIHDAFANGSGFFQHGHTYNGHPAACAAGLAVLERLTHDGLVDRSARMGARLHDALCDAFGAHPNIGDIRGRGLFYGLEIVADRGTKAPFDPHLKTAARIKAAAFDAGLICYPMSGTIDGHLGDHVLLAPPFIVTDAQIDELVEKLGRAFVQVLP